MKRIDRGGEAQLNIHEKVQKLIYQRQNCCCVIQILHRIRKLENGHALFATRVLEAPSSARLVEGGSIRKAAGLQADYGKTMVLSAKSD